MPASRLDGGPKCGRCKHALAAGTPVSVESAADFDEITLGSPLPVVVDFWAAWCGPCRAVAPELEKLARARAGRVLVVKVDTEAVPDVAARYGIRSIPTCVRFDAGVETRRTSGAMPMEALAAQLGV